MSIVRGVRAALRDEIISGRWKPGVYLPSVRKLAERFDTSKSSIHNILKMLQDEGLLQLCPGRGALVTDCLSDHPVLQRFFLRPSDFGTFNYLPVASGIISGILRGAENRNSEVTISFSDAENITEALIHAYSRNEIQGMVYCQCKDYENLILPLEKAGVPYVIAHDIHGINATKCMIDYPLIIRHAVDYLVERGHRKIGFWCGTVEDYIYRKGMEEYLRLIDEYHLKFKQEWLLINITNTSEKEAGLFFKQKELPTAVITMRDYRAKLFYETAVRHSMDIPRDISIVSWDNSTWDEATAVGLTTFEEPLHELGETAVVMLQQWVTSGSRPENRVIRCSLKERDSVIVVNSTN